MLRWRRKNYNAQLAPRMWRYVIDAAAKVYAKEIAPDERWDRVLSPATRDIVAAEMTQDFERLAAAGSLDGLVARSRAAPSAPTTRAVAPAPLAALFTSPVAQQSPEASAMPVKMPEPEFVVRRRAARVAAATTAAAVAASPMQQLIAGPVAAPEPEQQAEIVQFPAGAEGSTPTEVFYRRRP